MGASRDICLGVITGAVGVRGEVRIKAFTENPRDVAAYGPVSTKSGRSFKLSQVNQTKAGISAKLSGVETRD
jgi:16S rRNA processing protein RimM